jgi:hypothetical protein
VAWSLQKVKTVNIDKVDSHIGSGSETAASENFGGGFLSLQASGGSFGGTGLRQALAVEEHEMRGRWLFPSMLWGNIGGRSATRTFFGA